MADTSPLTLTVGDLVKQGLKQAGIVGIGQTPLAEDIEDGWSMLQFMLQTWQRKTWLVYHLVTLLVTSTGKISYTVGSGPTNDIDVGVVGLTSRPAKLESAFLRQLVQSQPNQIDYPLRLIQSMNDYNQIALKGLESFPGAVFYDPAWPSGNLFAWPVPQADIYAIGACFLEQLPASFTSLTEKFSLPYEYYLAMISNLGILMRPKYGLGTFPGDMLPSIAKNALLTLREANTAIAELSIPADLARKGIYNIFSDQTY
jgi:hypothetical protein